MIRVRVLESSNVRARKTKLGKGTKPEKKREERKREHEENREK